MRITRLVLAGCLALLVVSCGSKTPRELIIGTWSLKDKDGGEIGTLEFKQKDDELILTHEGETRSGKYEFKGDKEIEIKIDNPLLNRPGGLPDKNPGASKSDDWKPRRVQIEVTQDELIIKAIDADKKVTATTKGKRVSTK